MITSMISVFLTSTISVLTSINIVFKLTSDYVYDKCLSYPSFLLLEITTVTRSYLNYLLTRPSQGDSQVKSSVCLSHGSSKVVKPCWPSDLPSSACMVWRDDWCCWRLCSTWHSQSWRVMWLRGWWIQPWFAQVWYEERTCRPRHLRCAHECISVSPI